jgi:hypothetical protein
MTLNHESNLASSDQFVWVAFSLVSSTVFARESKYVAYHVKARFEGWLAS